jgi:hypothetical protein
MRGVDLSVIRAISETKGKLAKTTVTNYKGRYSLSLTKGFYKIIAAKPGLKQASPLSVRVKSNLKPRTEKIVMIETRTETNLKQISNSNTRTQEQKLAPGHNLHPYISNSKPLTSKPKRSFSDSGEIVEKYSGEIKEIGKKQSKAEQPDEKPDHDIPNWKFT